MFFFFSEYKDALLEAFELQYIKELANSDVFYFQKAKDKFDEFVKYDVSSLDLSDLIKHTQKSSFSFEKWLNSYDTNSEEYKLLLLIGQAISYFDTNASMKNKLNEYEDKRVLAKAMVRQNRWVKWMLELKKGTDVKTFPGNIRNAINFIQNPERNIHVISDNYRKNISEKLFPIQAVDLFGEMSNLGIKAKNPMNNGVLYTWILYSDKIKVLWLETKEESAIITIDELLLKFKEYISQIKPSGGTANSYKTAMSDTLDYLEYDANIPIVDIVEIRSRIKRLLSEFESNSQEIISKMKPCFSRAESYLTNGFVRAALPYFISFLTELTGEDVNSQKKSNSVFLKWFEPIITALKELGGSATRKEVTEKIIESYMAKNVGIDLKDDKKTWTDIAFARQYLVFAGYIDNSVYGQWILTEKGKTAPINIEIAGEIQKEYLKKKDKRYWIYTPGEQARLWEDFYNSGIMGIGWDIGDLTGYDSKNSIKDALQKLYSDDKSHKNDTHALWEFANKLSVGDVIFVKKGHSQLLGRGIVESDYIFDDERTEYKHIRRMNWTHSGEWAHPGQAVQKTLTDITAYTDYVEKLKAVFHDENELIENEEEPATVYDVYIEEDFLNDVYISPKRYGTLKGLLLRKKNIILQGAPGVGKTFSAKRLAYSIMEKADTSRVKVVQFHQSYSYEDFIQGWRPDGRDFKLEDGPFYKFCKLAEVDDETEPYFFIIDEINRGNLSKIFGELLMLIEVDKRGDSIRLLYKDEQFSVPKNVHIIGIMNTADRSLAMIDYALRRRFAFFDMAPAFQSDGFKAYQNSIGNSKFDNLIATVERLNADISKDASLGDGFRIGHSYFCVDEDVNIDDDWLSDVVEYELIPLLNEYWFDEPKKSEEWSRQLRGAING